MPEKSGIQLAEELVEETSNVKLYLQQPLINMPLMRSDYQL